MSDDITTAPKPNLDDFRDRARRNPFQGDLPTVQPIGALALVESQRGVAEVQARMLIARANPRNALAAMDAILRDCTRPSLAKDALYQYARGGSSVSGPSIRLAEAIARRWGNIASGIKEISRSGGYSECIAYAWDLESGYYDERQFQVRHWRDTRITPQNPNGGYMLTDERDIYELIANMGQRRKRAVLLTVIPGDVVEAAEEQCEETLTAVADTSPEGLVKLAQAFQPFGVTRAQIEKRCQCRLEAIRPAQVVQLRKIYTSLKDEMSMPADWFGDGGAWGEIAERHAQAAQEPAQDRPAPKPRGSRAQTQKPPETPPEPPPAANETAEAEPPADAVKPPAVDTPPIAPTAGGDDFTFDHWLVDEAGDPLGDQSITRAHPFALRLEARWQISKNRDALLQQNTDAMEAASAADPRAAQIIASLAATPAPAVIETKTGRDGVVWPEYLRDYRAAAKKLTPETYLDFYAANRATMKQAPMSTLALLVKVMAEQAKALDLEGPADMAAMMTPATPPPPPPPPPEVGVADKDRRVADNILEEIARCTDVNMLELYSRGEAVSTPRRRWHAESKMDLFNEVTEAFKKRHLELGGKPKE